MLGKVISAKTAEFEVPKVYVFSNIQKTETWV